MRCDSHVHIVGPVARYPQVANRTYQSSPADLATLTRLGAERDVRRFVIVQPSFYGTDNTATLEASEALGDNGRAVAVIDPAAATPDMLQDFHRRGVRGLRINLYSGLLGSATLETTFGAIAKVAKSMKWHVQVIAGMATLAGNADILVRSPVPVVIDHYGLHGALTVESGEGTKFLDLLRLPHVWVKLSGPYRNSTDPMKTTPDQPWLDAMLRVAEDRCVWGSDWPFTPAHDAHRGPDVEIPNRTLRYDTLLDDFIAAVGSPERVRRIMETNPQRLYGFADSKPAKR